MPAVLSFSWPETTKPKKGLDSLLPGEAMGKDTAAFPGGPRVCGSSERRPRIGAVPLISRDVKRRTSGTKSTGKNRLLWKNMC